MNQLERAPSSPLDAASSGAAGEEEQQVTGSQVPMLNAPSQNGCSPPVENGLDAFRDAREIVRLVQCSICWLPLRQPMALPCGNSLCQRCLPEIYRRESISYPNAPERQDGFQCPFESCGKEHSLADCAVDFTLLKVMEVVKKEMEAECASWATGGGSEESQLVDMIAIGTKWVKRRRIMQQGGRLAHTFVAAEEAQLPYLADVVYASGTDEDANGKDFDYKLLQRVKERAYPELECQVCYALLLDPITTYCGHTFCRKCLQRVLDHSQSCPSCRQKLQLPSVLPAQCSNLRLTEILVGLCPDALAQRAAAAALEEKAGSADNSLATPIFVCTASFPGMPTPLFIFEPRYRLMMRRAWEDNRRFGMVLPNRSGVPQGELGEVPFMQCGTMLEIQHMQVHADGRSHIWTTGVHKFRIRSWDLRDDYVVADVDRLDDIPVAEEEAAERLETSLRLRMPSPSEPGDPTLQQWSQLSTQALLRIGHAFVQRMQSMAVPWVHSENLLVFGNAPDDPAMFPYWMASILPIDDQEKYRLIATTSVRERMKIAVSWIKKIESHCWYRSPTFIKYVLYFTALLIGVLGCLLPTVL